MPSVILILMTAVKTAKLC